MIMVIRTIIMTIIIRMIRRRTGGEGEVEEEGGR
jgi:hypothetical protein